MTASGQPKWWLALLLAVAAPWLRGGEPPLLPPSWESRVVFHLAFEQGPDQPEINTLGAKIRIVGGSLGDGFTGRGLSSPPTRPERPDPLLELTSPKLSVDQPLTVMTWWRLDQPMIDTTCFALLAISNRGGRHGGYISTFVRGKGQWCALKKPTQIYQLYSFPDITNWNNPWSGSGWYEAGTWHHVAITVGGARQIDFYIDGRRTVSKQAVGRLFTAGDTNLVSFGPSWLFHPMTLDEVVVIDRVLTADELAAYVEAARALRSYPDFPVSEAP